MAKRKPEKNRNAYMAKWVRKHRAKLRWARVGNIDERTVPELRRLRGSALLADDAALQVRVEQELKRRGEPLMRRRA